MADRKSRSASRRTTPQPPLSSYTTRNSAPQSPPYRITRSTKSRSVDSDSLRLGLKRGQKKAGQATRTGSTTAHMAKDNLQHARQEKGRTQSRSLQDLPTVIEDLSVPDRELLQGELDEADQTAGRGKAPPKRFSGPTSPGATSGFSGNTARISGSAPSWADSDPAEEFVQDSSKNVDYSERAIDATGAQVRPFFQALSAPLDTALREIDVPQLPKSKFVAFTSSNTRFNSPRIIQGAASYLKQLKANRKASREFQERPQQSLVSVRNFPVAGTENPSVRASTQNQRISKPAISSSGSPKMQMDLYAGNAEKEDARLQPPRVGWQDQDFENDIESSTEPREEVYIMAGRVKETKAQLEADNNKENLAELLGPSRKPQNQPHTRHPAQDGKKKFFIDAQPNAERLRFDDSQDSPQRTQPSRKRRRNEALEDHGDSQMETVEVSSDEGFQRDRRAIGAVSKTTRTRPQIRVAREPVVHQRASPKKAPSTSRNEYLEDEPRGAVPLHNQEETLQSSQFDNYKKANAMAKRNVAVLPKKVQSRKAWTEEETEALISLIGDHGVSWKLLKEQDNANGSILEARDQVALKDKARNMKFDYLKAGPVLPHNFESVPLNKMQMDTLRSLGIVYNPATGQRDEGEIETRDTDEE